MMLLAEDLLLLLLDDESGKALVDSTRLPRVLAGALLLDLALTGTIEPDRNGTQVKKGRLVVRSEPMPPDPLLAEVVRTLAAHKPMKPPQAVEKLAKGLRERLLERIVDRGWVREERGKILGLFPTRSWPAIDDVHERGIRTELSGVLVDGLTPAPRTAALISLLSAVDAAPKLLPGADKRAVKRRAKEIAEGEWAGAAVRKAVDAVNAAVVTAVTVPVIVVGSS